PARDRRRQGALQPQLARGRERVGAAAARPRPCPRRQGVAAAAPAGPPRPRAPTTMPRDRELAAGSAAHYEDPAYYTQTYRARFADVRYYVDLAAARGGPVLEYGCGNGRITI